MKREPTSRVRSACQSFNNDPTRLVDVARAVQAELGCVDQASMDIIAEELSVPRAEVAGVVSFYAFLTSEPQGDVVIRLCDDIIDRMHGSERVADALREELGIDFGQTTRDGLFSLERAACIGMSDQAPAALVGDVVVTRLSTDSARALVRSLRRNPDPTRMRLTVGDGNNAHPLVRSMVVNNLREKGEVIFAPFESGSGLHSALSMSPVEVIKAVKASRVRGRGGAGFPVGMKWEYTRASEDPEKYVVCNADEGEPGTFKDRVLLTERAHMVIEGMTIAGYAMGATRGIIYLRAEYAYLRRLLEDTIAKCREAGLLGDHIAGKTGFSFDVTIQMGAGAYICGEETALINSVEGHRGDPRNRPPYPAQAGVLGHPTSVNNVETFCCVSRILQKGAGWFSSHGTTQSTGTKLLSISGDCGQPGIYELPFGVTLREVLAKADAEDAIAVQVGGASGRDMVPPSSFDRKLCYDDLATGGSIMVFGPERDILEVVHAYMEFFAEESCGYCTPCRVGTQLLRDKMGALVAGRAGPDDIPYLTQLSNTVKSTSRCGLGQSAPNAVLSTLEHFRHLYDEHMQAPLKDETLLPSFDINAALASCERVIGRKSVIFPNGGGQ